MRRLLIVACAMGMMLIAPSAHAATQPVYLETRDVRSTTSREVIGPVKSRSSLTAGKPYIATVKGTWSYFAAFGRACGKPERRPTYPSPGVRNGRAVGDAEFLFADARDRCRERGGRALTDGIQFRIFTSDKYRRVAPLGKKLTRPTKSHSYRYPLLGSGKRAGFQLLDSKPNDNYGRLRIVVEPAKARNCARGGFGAFGLPSEVACVAATRLAR